jgi:Flp pilus assembly protein TadD
MDQLSAHLDRGWDLAQRGDAKGAEASARQALDLDDQSPEAYNLLGHAAALEGDYETAMEHYRHAIALDDTYVEAILNAAELHVHPLGEYEEAARLCDQALDLVEDEDDIVDTLLLKLDALLGQNDLNEARRVCARLPRGPFENRAQAFLIGRALFEVGQTEEALPLIEDSAKAVEATSEAHYYLGLAYDEQGRNREATRAFLTSRQLDAELGPPPWALSRAAFDVTVREALRSLPDDLRQVVSEEEIYVGDLPGVEVVSEGVDPRALVLLDAPEEEQKRATNARLFVYQRNVERVAGAVDRLGSELADALSRELRWLQEGGPDESAAAESRERLPNKLN